MDEKPIVMGLNEGWTNDEYHSSQGVSKSHLDDIAIERKMTPRHYWAKRVDPNRKPEEKTDALIFGDAYHVASLQPDVFHSQFVAAPEGAPARPSSRQVKAAKPSPKTLEAIDWWNEFDDKHRGKTAIKREDMATVLTMRDVLLAHPIVGPLVKDAQTEQTFFAREPVTNALIKCRVDGDLIQKRGMLFDLKSTMHADPDSFTRDARIYRYPVQGFWYPYVIHTAYDQDDIVEDFAWIAQEKDWPHCVGLYYCEPHVLNDARLMAMRDLAAIVECRASDNWPDFTPTSAMTPMRVKYYY